MIKRNPNLYGKRILLAVSGGLDSVCMLDYFARNALELGVTLAVAHVDHGIRGDESAGDAEFVRQLANKYALPFYFINLGNQLVDVPNVEERARELRYEFLHKCKNEGNYDFIATAHHGDDQAETLYMRLARGTSLVGLRGVKQFREDGVFRPLLHVFRKDLREYAIRNSLAWREDCTNNDSTYRRNFVRNVVLPELECRSPGFKLAMSNVAELSASVLEKVLQKAEIEFSSLVVPKKDWPFYSECSPFANVLAFRFSKLDELLKRLGAGGEELFRLWLTSKGFDIAPGSVRSPIFPLPERRLDLKFVRLEKSLDLLWFMDLRSIRKFDILYFCKAKNLPEGAVWRNRYDGDFYSPPGMHCKRRKLSKWLQENGIPPFVRDFLPVLALENNVLRVATLSDFDLNK